MTSDGRGDSRRRHRRSSSPSDEEFESISKRHKHRHHRHSRKKHEDKIKDRGEDTSPLPPFAPPSVQAPNSRPDDDLEEGEILEDGFHSDGDKSISQSKLLNLGDDTVQEKLNDAEMDSNEKVGYKYQYSGGGIQNGVFSLEADDSREKHKESISSPSKGNDKKKRHKNGSLRESKDSALSGQERLLSHTSDERSKEPLQSPYQKRYKNGDYIEDNEHSGEFVRERSLSQSIIIGEDTHPKAMHRGESNSHYDEKSRDDYDSDYHRKTRHSRDHRHDARDVLKSDGREESVTHYNATHRGTSDSYYAEKHRDGYDSDDYRKIQHGRDDRHGSRDVLRSDGREGSANYSRYSQREDVRYRSRERATDEQRGEEKEKKRVVEADRDYRKKRERDRSMDRECDHESKREGRRESTGDVGINRDRQRERERERSKEKVRDRERSREEVRDRERSREEVRDRERSREEVRDRDRSREKVRDRDRSREKERDSKRERYTERDCDRDVQSYKAKYESLKDGHRYSDKYRYAKHSGYDQQGNRHVESRKDDIREGYLVNKARTEDGQSKPISYGDDEQQDMDESVTLELTLNEEEDIEKIKEESRRRRQAIMEKYKNKPLVENVQQEVETLPENSGKGLPTQPMTTANAVPEPSGDKESGDNDQSFSVRKSPQTNGSDGHANMGASGLGEGTPKSERSADMFYDDIFGESPTGVRISGKGTGLQIERSGLHDNWDDAEGYYSYRFGEILDCRYEILAAHGKGVFSTVVRAKDLKAGIGEPQEVAVKILRNKEAMYKAGVEELGILNKLVGADPDDKRHCVRLLSSFKYRNHLCLVFESLSMNLREVLKKFGRNIGLKLTAVRTYAKQLFIALKHLRNCGVLHCDIKPDNMLVNEAKNVLKLCDFGNAMYAGKNEITPYLVSRFYRAPEIILGLPYDHPMDIWSVGCSLYELYTGKVLFPGPSNNDMLRLHMELKGSFPKKMLRKGGFIEQHFDQDLNFLATEEDPVTKKLIKRMILNIKPKDIGTIIKGSPGEDPKMLANFKDLLDKIFVLDPDKRLTVQQALSHPFITGK